MGWSLSYQSPREPELLDEFFVAVGKALYIANLFEEKCRAILRLIQLVEHVRQVDDLDAAIELTAALKARTLRRTIDGMKDPLKIKPSDIELLEKATDARNFIAHEGANIGRVDGASSQHIYQHLSRLREMVRILIDGDNIVSRWVYEIEEKEPAPRVFQEEYPALVMRWIFGGEDQ